MEVASPPFEVDDDYSYSSQAPFLPVESTEENEKSEPPADNDLTRDQLIEIGHRGQDLLKLIAKFNHLTDNPLKINSELLRVGLIHSGLIRENSEIDFNYIIKGTLTLTFANKYNKNLVSRFYSGKYPRTPDFTEFKSYLDTDPGFEDVESISVPEPKDKKPAPKKQRSKSKSSTNGQLNEAFTELINENLASLFPSLTKDSP